MNDLKWFYPKSELECLRLFNDGYRPHGGGTFLVKTSLNIEGLFIIPDNDNFKIRKFDKDFLYLGAALTYFEAADFAEEQISNNFLSKALVSAAATPLRNRITLGGSIAAAPKWSDLAGPLCAAGAKVDIAGRDETLSITELYANRNMRNKSLITSLKIPVSALHGDYYRFTFTGFDYPLFTLTISVTNKSVICAVTGSASGEIEILQGEPAEVLSVFEKKCNFNDERGLSGKYIKTRAAVELKRILEAV